MQDHSRRDSLVTILGLAVLVLGFIFGVFLPEHRSNQQLERDITTAKQDLINVPLRIAELEAMRQLLDRRKSYLQRCLPGLPAETDDQRVLNMMCHVADKAGVEVTGVRPEQSTMHQTYQCLAFHIEFQGAFHEVVAFLHGLETRQQLFRTESVVLNAQHGKPGGLTQGQVTVTTYAIRSDFEYSEENSDASIQVTADRRRRVSVVGEDPSVSLLARHEIVAWLDSMASRPAR